MQPDRLERIGEWLRCHQRAIRNTQWCVVSIYAGLLVPPAFLPLPPSAAGILDGMAVFAQFVFWGIWWPAVLVTTVLFGRIWCGLFCPEGMLSEFASRHGSGRAIPRWIIWSGWPFAAFVVTTVYGQLVSVYQYPQPALLVLGGSTLAAVLVGVRFGRGKRVWCRYLCPVSGVFGLLAKLSPLHFSVDEDAWRRSQATPRQRFAPVNCAPLVPLRTMRGASQCHMCGRCSGFRGAIRLAARAPSHEIVTVAGELPNPWESALLIFGLIGVAAGAFHWPVSPWFVAVKQAAAAWLVDHYAIWPMETGAPWWLLTHYPDRHDVLTVLDGALLLAYIAATALVLGTAVAICLALATRSLGPWSWSRFHHLAQSLIPVAATGVFLGLSALTVTMLRAEGYALGWVLTARALLLVAAGFWSLRLAVAITGRYSRSAVRRSVVALAVAGALSAADAAWILLFWVW